MQVGKDIASVGYYKTRLQSGVEAELSASRHAGIMEYSFPKGEKHILVDLSHVSLVFCVFSEDSDLSLTSTYLPPPVIPAANYLREAKSRLRKMASPTVDMGHMLVAGITVRF